MKTNNYRRLTAGALAAILLLSQTAGAAAPTVETDESVYINMDYYGIPDDMRIVKGVSLNGLDTFTDFGNYSDVYNMSTHDKPTVEDTSVTWNLTDSDQQRFYYECIPSDNSSIQLPWNFDVSYKINGVPATAEKCAGAAGLIEITVHATPNAAASAYYKNNMTLLVGTGIDMSKALSIEAPGAQIQSFGTYKLVAFLGMPGEESTFTVRIGSNSFESMGMVMLMAPATLSSLDMLADLRDIKDRLGNSGDSLYSGLSDMLSTMQSMQSGLGTLSGGISGINEVRKQLIASRGTLDPQSDAALAALDTLAGQSNSLIPELTTLKSTLATLNATTNSLLGTLSDTDSNVTEYQKLLRDINNNLGNLNDLIDALNDKTSDSWIQLSSLKDTVKTLTDDLSKLKSALSRLNESIAQMEQVLAGLSALPGTGDAQTDALIAAAVKTLGGSLEATRNLVSSLGKLCGSLGDLSSTTRGTVSTLQDIDKLLDDYESLPGDMTADGQRLTQLANTSLESIHKLLADIPALTDSLNVLTGTATSACDKGSELMLATSNALTASTKLLQSTQDTLRSVRDQSDQSVASSIDGLLDVLAKATASNSSSSLQSATDEIHSAIDDGKKDLEEDTNLINLDSAAALQSVTSSENPTPSSLQFILRTQEISVDDSAEVQQDEAATQDIGVFGRIVNIFKALFTAITGVFTQND